MKTPADTLVDQILELPTAEQLALLHGAVVDRHTGTDALDLFWSWMAGYEPQAAARFLAGHVDLFTGSMCKAADCDQLATHMDPTSVRDRAVCDAHGEYVPEPWDEAS